METIPKCIQLLLLQFAEFFSEPTVAPKRAVDHYITLIAGTRLISVRPYRYAQSQKTEIETQVTDMLKARLIRHSTSHSYSLVLLVKKGRRMDLEILCGLQSTQSDNHKGYVPYSCHR